MFRYHVLENFGGVKFWQIVNNEANGEDNLGGSDVRSSVVLLMGKNLANCASLTKFATPILSNI